MLLRCVYFLRELIFLMKTSRKTNLQNHHLQIAFCGKR